MLHGTLHPNLRKSDCATLCEASSAPRTRSGLTASLLRFSAVRFRFKACSFTQARPAVPKMGVESVHPCAPNNPGKSHGFLRQVAQSAALCTATRVPQQSTLHPGLGLGFGFQVSSFGVGSNGFEFKDKVLCFKVGGSGCTGCKVLD